ncbi:MAG: AAA family ATPase [Anaerolineae bacterium]
MSLQQLLDDLDKSLPQAPFARANGSLLMMVGLPGTGKSSIVESLHKLLPHVVISTDGMRAQLRERPSYTSAEMMLVYEVCYHLIERRLRRGQRIVFDASNYLAARRERVTRLAERNGAPVTVCYVQAAQDIIQQRLQDRNSGKRRATDMSEADWSVYKWMVESQEPVVVPHVVLDTSTTPPDELAIILQKYWLKTEKRAESNPDFQSTRWASKLGRRS